MSADHRNKADVGAGIARKWCDADGVATIFDVSNCSVSLAIATIKRIALPTFAIVERVEGFERIVPATS